MHGAAPAAYRALDIIAAAKNGDLQQGYDAEDLALADLIMGGELRSGIYAFNLVQKRGKRPAGAPDKSLARPVTKVGVVGAGLMASQLALLFLRRLEVPVVLTDIDQERVDKGVGYVHAEIDKLLGKGRINQDKANRLKALVTGVLDKAEGFSDADFIIEAVFEEIGVKQQVFAEVEAVAPAHAILATNTSSLSVTEMASKLKNPERVVGFHFFNPVAILPLLEIVRGEQTDDASLATAFAVAKKLKKTAVLVKDAPAFVVNRILTRFMGEIQNVIDEGTPVEVAEKAVEPLGLPMSPLVLLELVGPAIGLHVSETLNRAFPDRFTVSPNLAAVVKAGKRGFYVYDTGKPELDPEVAALLKQGDVVLTEEQVRDRVLDAVAQEIGLMLDEGVVAEAQDIDLCLITGAGWPFHLGGITPYLDREGVSERVNGKQFLAPGVASVPAYDRSYDGEEGLRGGGGPPPAFRGRCSDLPPRRQGQPRLVLRRAIRSSPSGVTVAATTRPSASSARATAVPTGSCGPDSSTTGPPTPARSGTRRRRPGRSPNAGRAACSRGRPGCSGSGPPGRGRRRRAGASARCRAPGAQHARRGR